jgi:hypothetical protein
MDNRVIHVPAHARVIAALILLLLAGCTAEKSAPTAERIVEVVTATPAAMQPFASVQPGPTYADAESEAIRLHNTAVAFERIATEQALQHQVTAAAATQAAVDRDAAILAATQQVEQANAQATQHAISVAATATTAAIALQRQQADMTSTAQALGLADAVATQEAARANELRIEAQETERKATQNDLDRQARFLVGLIVTVLTIVLASLAAWQGIRLLSVYVAIKARRMLVMEQSGLFIDAQTGRPEALPGYTPAPALVAPGDKPTRAERLRSAINPDALEAAFRADERSVRRAWKFEAWQFLRWSEHVPRGEDTPVGFSRRRLCDAARISQDAYHTMIGFLADLGLIEKENPVNPRSPWVLARDGEGQPMTVSQVLRHKVWLTSYTVPSVPSLPGIPHPPERKPWNQTKPTTANQVKPVRTASLRARRGL